MRKRAHSADGMSFHCPAVVVIVSPCSAPVVVVVPFPSRVLHRLVATPKHVHEPRFSRTCVLLSAPCGLSRVRVGETVPPSWSCRRLQLLRRQQATPPRQSKCVVVSCGACMHTTHRAPPAVPFFYHACASFSFFLMHVCGCACGSADRARFGGAPHRKSGPRGSPARSKRRTRRRRRNSKISRSLPSAHK